MTKENLSKAWTHVKGVWKQGAKDSWDWIYRTFNLYERFIATEEFPEYSYEDDPEMKELRKMPHKEFEADFWGEDAPPGRYSLKTME